MAAPVYFMSATGAGTGDGSSYANRAAYSHSRMLAKLAEWHTTPPTGGDDPWADGFRVLTGGTINGQAPSSTNPTVGGRVHRGIKVMRHDKAEVTIAGRIRLCGADGPCSVTGSPGAFTDSHSGIPGAGTAASPHRFFMIEADNGSGGPMADTGGTVDTVSTSVPGKAGTTADWENSAAYDAATGNWTGTSVSRTHSFTVHRPLTGFTFIGSRSNDPRTAAERHGLTGTKQLVADGSDRMVADPTSTSSNPYYKDANGNPYTGGAGDIFDMPSRTWARDANGTFSAGNYWMQNGASYLIFRGIRWGKFRAPFDNSPNRTHGFLHFRDIATDNTKYFNWRGSNASDYWGLRIQNVAWSQKAYVLGPNCSRWLFQHIYMDGAFVVGDNIKCGFSAVAPHDAGPLVVENIYGFCYWDAVHWGSSPGDTGKYFQGEGFDYECYNLQVENFKFELCGDAGFDTKARTRWAGYRPVVVINGGVKRARRGYRMWYPTYAFETQADGTRIATFNDGAWTWQNVSTMLDCWAADVRQYGLYAPTTSGDKHRIVEWDNGGTGWANFWNDYWGQSHNWSLPVVNEKDYPEGGTNGNITIVLWQPFMALSGTHQTTDGRHMRYRAGSEGALPTEAPFRRLTRTTNVPRPLSSSAHQLTAGGTLHDPDNSSGLSGTITLVAPATASWRATTGSLVVAGDKLSADYTAEVV